MNPTQEMELRVAAIVADYVGKRLTGLGLQPDATLPTPAHHAVVDEACSVANVAMYWAKVAVGVWTGGSGPLAAPAAKPAATPAPAATAPVTTSPGALIPAIATGVLTAAQMAGL